jgi:starch synthase (maltosyl-transferring)
MTQPLPIAFGVTDLDVGGAEKALVALVERLDRGRWAPSVVCLKPAGPLASRLKNVGVDVDSLEMTGTWDVRRGLSEWTAILRARRPLVLATFLFHANILGRLAARRAGVPAHLSSVRVAEVDAPLRRLIDRATRRWTDRYVCVSRSVAEFTQSTVGCPAGAIQVIPNGIDLGAVDEAAPVDLAAFGLGQEDRVLVFLGRLDRQKRPDLVVSAVERIRPQAESNRLRVVFVGRGPTAPILASAIRRRGLDGFFRFVGFSENPYGWLKAGGGLLLSSDWEGMPNAVLEAMACRRPVVATAAHGVAELVVDRQTGWLSPPGDAEGLSRGVLEWMSDADRADRFGRAGRERVERRFTIEKTVALWDELLSEVVGG